MKRLKTIVKKNEKRNGRKKEKKKKRREKKEKGKVPSHSQETQMNLKILGFLFLQGPNLFHFTYWQWDQTPGSISENVRPGKNYWDDLQPPCFVDKQTEANRGKWPERGVPLAAEPALESWPLTPDIGSCAQEQCLENQWGLETGWLGEVLSTPTSSCSVLWHPASKWLPDFPPSKILSLI